VRGFGVAGTSTGGGKTGAWGLADVWFGVSGAVAEAAGSIDIGAETDRGVSADAAASRRERSSASICRDF